MELKPGYKLTEVGVIPEEWEVHELRSLARIITGPFGTLLKASEYAHTDGVPLISVGEVGDGSFRVGENTPRVSAETTARLPQYLLRAGDIVFGRKGAVERSALVSSQEDGWFLGSDGISVRSIGKSDPAYLAAQLRSAGIKSWLMQNAVGTTMPSLNQRILGQVRVPIAPILEQFAIAEALSDVDALLSSLDALIAKKRDLKQAAMQQLLTGKTRLPGFSGEWEPSSLGNVVVNFIGGGTPSRANSEYWGGEIPWVTVKDLSTFHPRRSQETITRIGLSNSASNLIPAGTLITSTRMALGKAVVYSVDVAINQDMKALSFKPGFRVDFMVFWFAFFGWRIEELGGGSTVKGVSVSQLKRVELLIPRDEEQSAIAQVLSDMDTEFAALEAQREKTRMLKQGMMQELLTGRTRLVPLSVETTAKPAVNSQPTKSSPPTQAHNWAINEAVVVSVLVKNFGSEQYPLGRKRHTKLAYLMHRHVEHTAQGYLKKAAGPYNPEVKYGGPETIATKNGYIRVHSRGTYSGFVAAERIAEAEAYFEKWYGQDVLRWLEHFRRKTNDELELLTTVDMAMQDLKSQGQSVTVETVKAVIRENPEWKPKLDRALFADSEIQRAIGIVDSLFSQE